MKGYEWGKGTVNCGLCGIAGHNVTSCPAVNIIYKKYCDNLKKHGENYFPTYSERKVLREVARREKTTIKPKQKRRKARCSFCNSVKHKRNRCRKLTKFKAKVEKANENWRRYFIAEANAHGFGIGSLVSVPMGMMESYYPHSEGSSVGIVSGFNKNKLNVFCSYGKGGLFSGVPAVEVLVEGEAVKVIVSRLKANWSKDLIPNRSGWQFYEVLSINADSAELPDEWYTADNDNAIKWFFDNISMKNKDFEMLEELIQKWTKIVLPK